MPSHPNDSQSLATEGAALSQVGLSHVVLPHGITPSLDPRQAFEARYLSGVGMVAQDLHWQAATANLGQVIYPLPELDAPGLWLLQAGQVRLLGWSDVQQKFVSIELLQPGDMFGFESLLESSSSEAVVAYQAIATGDCHLLCLPLATTQRLLAKASNLRLDLQAMAQRRSRLAFFRTQTMLDSPLQHSGQPVLSLAYWQQFIATVQWLTLAPDSDLSQCSGRCWLVSGRLMVDQQVLPLGSAWGPEPLSQHYVVATEVHLYQLPLADWQRLSAQISSLLNAFPLASEVSSSPEIRPAAARSFSPAPNSGGLEPAESALSKRDRIRFPLPQWQRYLRFNFPFLAQQSLSDCGVTCLAMIGRYWGAPAYPLQQLREWSKVGRSGASLKNLAYTAEKLGFVACPVRASLNVLQAQKRPWIAHWQGDHYIVVYAERQELILVADPAVGKRQIPRREFMQSWSGYALTLEPTKQVYEQTMEPGQKLSNFGQILFSYRPILVQIILISLLIQVFGLLGPLLTQIIFDRVVTQKSFSMLHLFAIGLLIFGAWRIAMGSVRQYLLDYFGNRLELTLVSAFIRHTLSLPLAFFEARHVGDIITRIQENTKIQQFLMRQAVSTWLDALMGIAYLGLMFYYNVQLTLVVMALIPPLVILTLVATPFLKRISRQAFKESAEQTSLVVEMISGIAAVKTAAIEQEIRWRWEERLARTLNVQFKGQKLTNILQVISGLINTLGSTALLWYGANLVIQNQITIGQLVAFNMLIGNVLGPAISVIGVWDEFQEVLISVERLNDVFATTPEESKENVSLVLPHLRGEVRCDRVTFAYDGAEDRLILQGLEFVVQPGETVAVVGRSGSGKTTLIKLLQGFYHPTEGRVLMDGHDVQHISPLSLRLQLGVVPQDCFLFSGSILENIRLYRPDYSLETVVEVAKLAEAHHFIQELPMGYNTKVGERGTNLSGGQRQRIAIARALLGNPSLLILDEATSALDTESERRFQRNLARISRDRTTFIIAHRLSTVQKADRILVLDRGLLVEQGNHEMLMQQKGLYYHLAQQQLNL